MFAIRARRKTVTEKDFLDAVNKARPHNPLLCSDCKLARFHKTRLSLYVAFRVLTEELRFSVHLLQTAGHQGLPKVQCNTQVHAVQLSGEQAEFCAESQPWNPVWNVAGSCKDAFGAAMVSRCRVGLVSVVTISNCSRIAQRGGYF